MLTLPPYREVQISRPPPPPLPDRTPLIVRTTLAGFFGPLLLTIIAAMTLAPESESDRIREAWHKLGYAPPPTGSDVTVLPGQLRYLTHDPRTSRLVLGTGRSPPELWDTTTGRVAILYQQVGGIGQALFSPDRNHLLTTDARQSRPYPDDGKSLPQIRIWDAQTGQFIRSISIPSIAGKEIVDWRLRWLDDRHAQCVARFLPKNSDRSDELRWVRRLDVVTGMWGRYDADDPKDIPSEPLSGDPNDNIVTQQPMNVVSAQFGKCYVWSANYETRILLSKDP